jgi:hypothetical protein
MTKSNSSFTIMKFAYIMTEVNAIIFNKIVTAKKNQGK